MRKATIALAFCAASGAAAQNAMVPLERILQSQPEKTYLYVRCAAFYLANVEWAGQALSEEVFNRSKRSVEDLLLIATLVRASESADGIEHISGIVNLDTRQVADLYLENYRSNYALTGTAWDGNSVWEADSATCQPIAEAATVVAAEIREN